MPEGFSMLNESQPTVWGKSVSAAEVDTFTAAMLPIAAAHPQLKGTFAGKTPSFRSPHLYIAAGAARDFNISEAAQLRMFAVADAAYEFQKSYLAGRWEGAKEMASTVVPAMASLSAENRQAFIRQVHPMDAVAVGHASAAIPSAPSVPRTVPPMPSTDPVAAFAAAMSREVAAAGGDRAKGTAEAVRKYPELHRAYLAAVNAKPAPTADRGHPLPAPPVAVAGDPVSRWKSAVAAKTSAGMPMGQAIAAVVKENPELHRDYLAAVNRR
jgi:hypothetical protein